MVDIITTDKTSDTWITQQFESIFNTNKINHTRMVQEMTWFRNILYYLGEQWIAWFRESGTFGRRYELTGTLPTPVTNVIREYVRAMKALLLNKSYTVRVWPNSNEARDKDAALLSEQVLRYLDAEDDDQAEEMKEWLALWTVLTGNGLLRTYPEVDDGVYTANVPVSRGKVGLEIILPFNLYTSTIGTRLEDKKWIGIKSVKDREWVEDTFKINVTQDDYAATEYEQQLYQLVSEVSPWKGRGIEAGNILETSPDNLVIFKELEYAPTRDYPQGRYLVMAGKTIVTRDSELPMPDAKDQKREFSVTHFPYNFTPGSMWATGGVDDLISPQNTINEVDQALSINRKSIGRPMILTPAQLTMKRLSGRSGLLAVEYDGRNAAGAKPEFIQGVPYPQQILEERNIQRQHAQDAAGDPKNILRGQTPGKGASGVMVDILREAAELSHTPDIKRFYRNWKKVERKRLIIAQSLFTESRLLKIPGAGNSIYVKAFRGSDMRNNLDVRLEIDSGLSATNAGRNEMIVRLIQGGFWGDMSQRPGLQRELAKRMGVGTIPDEENLHRDKAEKENSKIAYGDPSNWKTVAFPDAPVPNGEGSFITDMHGRPITMFPKSHDPSFHFDNHMIHQRVHLEYVLSAEFEDLPRSRQRLIIGHLDMHTEAMKVIDEENTANLAQKAALGVIESGGKPLTAPPTGTGGPGSMMVNPQQGMNPNAAPPMQI